MASVRRSYAAAALVALVLVLVAGPASARAEDTDGQRLDALERLAPPAADPADPAGEARGPVLGLADVHCARDARGDTFVLVGGDGGNERQDPWPEPRADMLSFCADYGERLELRVRVAQPTDPSGWTGQSGVYVYLDLQGDGQFDRAVVYQRGAAGPRAVVAERAGGGWQPLDGCAAQAAFEESPGDYVVHGILPDCLAGSARLELVAVTAFQTEAGREVNDSGDHRLSVGRAGVPTLRPARRLAGPDRYATAVAISRERFPEQAPAAYLARADTFADALAAGSLPGKAAAGGPILLVPSCGALPESVGAEIERLDPDRLVALGGQSAVCDGVLREAARAGDGDRATGRLAGDASEPTRWGTAVAISRHAYPAGGVDEVYLATGEDFPDALAAGTLDGGPLLLVPACGRLPAAVEDELARLAPRRVVALGGGSAVCEEVLDAAVAAAGGTPARDRLAGPTRYDTAAEISAYRFSQGAARVYVARADDFPDALAGGVLAGGPILLVPRCGDLPAPIAFEIRRLDPDEVVALGGRGAVCEATLRHAANA